MHYLKYFFILFALGFYAQNLSAQLSYTPFPEGEAVWHVAYWEDECPIPFPCRFDQYAYKGDTMVNNLTYHRLYYTYQVFGEVTQGGYKGLIRQDTAQKKVYYFPSNEPGEYLLYDFNLQIGDTLPVTYNHGALDEMVVENIDTLLMNGAYRKSYRLLPPNYNGDTTLLIEGIGATSGLINALGTSNGWERYSLLTCFQADGETIYSPYDIGLCTILGIVDQNNTIQVSLQPNPVRQGSELTLTSDIPTAINAKIFNVFGNLIWESEKDSNEIKWDTRLFNRGIYFVKVFHKEQFIALRKIIVL